MLSKLTVVVAPNGDGFTRASLALLSMGISASAHRQSRPFGHVPEAM